MRLIDRYIVVEFSRVFLICFLTFLGLFIVADFVNNFDELAKFGKDHGGLGRVALAFYGPRVPWFFDMVGRVVALVAAVFAVTSLQRHNEMAAMMAAGISRWRIVKPLVYGVGTVAILGMLNRELVIPQLREAISRDAKNFSGDRTVKVWARYDNTTDIFFDGEGLRVASREIEQPKFHLPSNIAARGTRLEAELAKYLPRTKDRPAGFLMTGVTSPKNAALLASIYDGEIPLLFGPADTEWLEQDQLFVPTDLPFEHLRSGNNWRRHASTFSLIAGARNASLGYGADVNVAIHSRILQPVADLLLFFLGMPIVLSKESRNAFIAMGSCMLLIALFVIVSLGFQSMGMNYLMRPSLSAWAPVVIFLPTAVFMSEPLRR